MHVRVTDKRKANIWFACALYYNRHMPGVVSIPNFSLFWIYVLNNAPGKKNLDRNALKVFSWESLLINRGPVSTSSKKMNAFEK